MKILLTGVSSGIGLYLAQALRGEEVWGLARRNPLDKVCSHFSACDVSQWSAVEGVARDVRATWSRLDAIIHCAGTQGAVGQAMTVEPLEWVNTVRSNVEGAYFILRAFFCLLRHSQNRSKIILFSGGGASKPRQISVLTDARRLLWCGLLRRWLKSGNNSRLTLISLRLEQSTRR